MNLNIKLATLAVSILCLSMPAWAENVTPVPAKAELKLVDGANDIKTGDMALRIVKAFVPNLTASSFYTYTVFVLPEKNETQWSLVTNPSTGGMSYNFREYESGDSNTQSISFYKSGDKLYAVQATKEGMPAPDINLKKADVKIRVYKFNQDGDVPMFNAVGTMQTKARYMDASEALHKEFFAK
jgi:hypothetical protein